MLLLIVVDFTGDTSRSDIQCITTYICVCVYNNVLLVCDDDRLSINLYKSHITAAAILTCISPRALLLLYFFYIILYIIIYYIHPALCTMPRQYIYINDKRKNFTYKIER